jgi:hypothetical protein
MQFLCRRESTMHGFGPFDRAAVAAALEYKLRNAQRGVRETIERIREQNPALAEALEQDEAERVARGEILPDLADEEHLGYPDEEQEDG